MACNQIIKVIQKAQLAKWKPYRIENEIIEMKHAADLNINGIVNHVQLHDFNV